MSALEFTQEELDGVDSQGKEAGGKQNRNGNGGRKQCHVFIAEEDIRLLKEVAFVQPFDQNNSTQKWKEIHERLKIDVKDGAVLKRHFTTIYKNFISNNTKSLKKSGVEEDYTEKMHLLEEIRGLMETAKSEKNEKLESESQSEQNIKEQAKVIRDAALSTFKRGLDSPTSEGSGSTNKRPKQDNMMDIIMKAEQTDNMLRNAEHELEKRKLTLQEKELELRANELELKTKGEEHKREFELKKLALEERRIQMEEERFRADKAERKLLLELLAKKD